MAEEFDELRGKARRIDDGEMPGGGPLSSTLARRACGRGAEQARQCFRTTETFQRRHFGHDPIRTLAPEKSIPGPIFDMKRAGSWRASVVDLRSEEVSTSTPALYVSPQFPMSGSYGAGLGWWREAAAASRISGTWEASYSSIKSPIRFRNAACG